jgi:signal transduction histidine kinase
LEVEVCVAIEEMGGCTKMHKPSLDEVGQNPSQTLEVPKLARDARGGIDHFSSVFQLAKSGFAIVGLNGTLLQVNPALRLLLNSVSRDCEGISLFDYIDTADRTDVADRFAGIASGTESDEQSIKCCLLRREGTVSVRMTLLLIRNSLGNPHTVMCQCDKVAEQDCWPDKNRAYISKQRHDLRTPLTSVLGALSLLSMAEDHLSDESKRLLFIAEENAKRLNLMIGEIGQFDDYENNLHDRPIDGSD